MIRRAAPLFALVAVLCGSCDNAFSPKEEYRARLVVYAVLDATAPFQLVRLESTYDAEGATPEQPKEKRVIDSAVVTMASPRKVYAFHDTTLDLGGGAAKKVWISRVLVPEEGTSYTLTVRLPDADPVTAEVTVPSKSYVRLLPPDASAGRYGVEVSTAAQGAYNAPKGYLFRLFVTAHALVDGKTVEIRREVPLRTDNATGDSVYPVPSRDPAVTFSVDEIGRIRGKMENEEGGFDFWLVAKGYSMDTYLYSYFQTVRGFDDPVSVRQDRPDVTNVHGGIGIFGAMVTDSLRSTYQSIVGS